MSIVRTSLFTLATLALAAPAQAQYYGGLIPAQPYEMRVAPRTHLVHRSAAPDGYPYVDCGRACRAPDSVRYSTRHSRMRRALIVNSHRMHGGQGAHDKPLKRTVPVDRAPGAGREFRRDRGPRVIRAEAEVTILGPDRMGIRLFRKRTGPEAKAYTNE